MKKVWFIGVWVFIFHIGYGQIVDDSTRQIYSAKTVKLFTEEDIFYNQNAQNLQDTIIQDFHRYSWIYRQGMPYQDLGVMGTSITPVFAMLPQTIGKRLGFESFDAYATNPSRINYYDTKSPFSSAYYVQGSAGQQLIEVQHTRNITPQWNMGIDLRRFVSLKQIGVQSRRDLQCGNFEFIAHTNYISKSKRYALLLNYSTFQHILYESGGIKPDSANQDQEDLFDYALENVNLESAISTNTRKNNLRSLEYRYHTHVYQQLALIDSNVLQLFHQGDYQKRLQRYDDPNLENANVSFYPAVYVDSYTTYDRTQYSLLENKLGLKGSRAGVSYSAYLRRRDFVYAQRVYEEVKNRYSENFIGAQIYWKADVQKWVKGETEYLLGRDFLFKAQVNYLWAKAGASLMSYSPSLIQLRYSGNSFNWNNSFDNSVAQQAYAGTTIKLGKTFHFEPVFFYNRVDNYIYWNNSALPQQANKPVEWMQVQADLKLNWKKLYFTERIIYTQVSTPDLLRMPKWFSLSTLYVQTYLFKKALFLQLGVDGSWKSGYYANAYMPLTQQFYLHQGTPAHAKVNAYFLTDVFVNTKIKNVLFFLRMSHVNQNLWGKGYMVTPYYSGMPRNFELGLRWLFFD